MESVQRRAVLLMFPPKISVSFWKNVVFKNKIKLALAEQALTSPGNSLVKQPEPQQRKWEDNSSHSVPSLFNKGFTYYKSHGSFDSDKRAGTFQRSLLSYTTIQVSVRTLKTMRGINEEQACIPRLFSQFKRRFFRAAKENVSPALTTDKLLSAKWTNDNDGRKAKHRHFQQILSVAVLTALLYSVLPNFPRDGLLRDSACRYTEDLPEDISITFDDAKGVDEAKNELKEIVEFLRNPNKFATIGGKLPKGVLLSGPTGTGKTLLARAIAGEAKVPFIHAEFDEILVEQGATRVRELFKTAKAKAPCVIFIDQIDSFAFARTSSDQNLHANQTINQLLSEMDGFRQNEGVIVLAATNRENVLDKALLRHGRFDVKVKIPRPDRRGRKVKRSSDVDVDVVAAITGGFTGADLENMVNQAAVQAAIEGADSVGTKHLEFVYDKTTFGVKRKSRVVDEETRRIAAYHLCGGVLLDAFTKEAVPTFKATIIPRANSNGRTLRFTEKKRHRQTRAQLLANMDVLMGGRVALELLYGIDKANDIASNDLMRARQIATNMVTIYGMSENVGLRTINGNPKALVASNDLGESMSEMINEEINRLVQESHDRAKKILTEHSKELKALAEALMKQRTLYAKDVQRALSDRGGISEPIEA